MGNRGKRSIALDLCSDDGIATLRALMQTAAVFVHSMRSKAKAIEKLGFSHEDVAAINPAIIFLLELVTL